MPIKDKAKRAPKTLKEKAFAKEYIKTLNATEAASKVYDVSNRDSARNIGSQNLAKLSFDEHFEKAGLTDGAIAQNITEAAYATDNILRDGQDKSVPDWATRLKAHELAIKIMGKFAPQKTDITSDGEKLAMNVVSYVEVKGPSDANDSP